VVQRNAGHKRFTTTEKYIGDIEKLSADCGVPFPFISSKFSSKKDDPVLQATGTFDENGRPYVDEFRTALVELAAAA
jgi:hypothetical protein